MMLCNEVNKVMGDLEYEWYLADTAWEIEQDEAMVRRENDVFERSRRLDKLLNDMGDREEKRKAILAMTHDERLARARILRSLPTDLAVKAMMDADMV